MKEYHKVVKAKVLSADEIEPGYRYWIDGQGNVCSTNTSHPAYLSDRKERIKTKAKKARDKINEIALKKANSKAKALAKLEERKAKILAQ